MRKQISIIALAMIFGTTLMAADKPNILVIWGDDIGQSNISAYTMGLVGYYRRFIKNFSKIGCPITALQKKGKRLEWKIDCVARFKQIIKKLCTDIKNNRSSKGFHCMHGFLQGGTWWSLYAGGLGGLLPIKKSK